MPIIDDADVQVHLPADKLRVEEIPDDLAKVKLDAERIIRGYLAGIVNAAVLALWTTPATTPDTIRAIAGRLAAATIYRLRYGEDSLDDPEFAQVKYAEAMAMLQGVVNGNIVLDPTNPQQSFDNTMFFPNGDGTAEPKFTMDSIF